MPGGVGLTSKNGLIGIVVLMKFLLVGINAKYIHSNHAIASLREYAGEAFADCVECAEYTINNLREDILEDIFRRKPDYIGFSVYIWNVSMVKTLLRDINSILPEVPVFLGGPEVSFNPEEYLAEFANVQGVFIGEGEETFKELLGVLKSEHAAEENETSPKPESKHGLVSPEHIKGLFTSDGFSAQRELLSGNNIPFFYSEKNIRDYDNKIIYYESSRGCPFRCSYCLSSVDKTVRFKDLDKVYEELGFFLKQRVPQVKFVDRTFNCDVNRAIKIWTFLKQNDNGVTNFHFEVEADLLNEEAVKLLEELRPGLVQLEIGVQSTNLKTLEAINRKMDISYTKKVVKSLVAKGNINIHLDLIAGLPFEDLESFKKSFDDIFVLRPHQLQLGFLKVLKGALINKQVEEFGIGYSKNPPFEVLGTKWLSYEDILELKLVEKMVEIYYNSGQFIHGIEVLAKKFDSAYDMFLFMGRFHVKRGLLVNNPKRAARYEIMLEIWAEANAAVKDGNIGKASVAGEDETENDRRMRDALTIDYYIREKPKARPDFVREIPAGLTVDYERRNPVTGNCFFTID